MHVASNTLRTPSFRSFALPAGALLLALLAGCGRQEVQTSSAATGASQTDQTMSRAVRRAPQPARHAPLRASAPTSTDPGLPADCIGHKAQMMGAGTCTTWNLPAGRVSCTRSSDFGTQLGFGQPQTYNVDLDPVVAQQVGMFYSRNVSAVYEAKCSGKPMVVLFVFK